MPKIWIVDVTTWYFDQHEGWAYLVAAQTEAAAIEKAKVDCGYYWKRSNQPDRPSPIWRFYARLLEVDTNTMMKIAYHNNMGGDIDEKAEFKWLGRCIGMCPTYRRGDSGYCLSNKR